MGMNPDKPILCIDLGTSHSKMAWYNRTAQQAEIIKNAESEEHTPSIVYYGTRATLIGKAAEKMLEDEQERQYVVTSIKRRMTLTDTISLPDGRTIRCAEVIAEILGKLKRDAEQIHFHQKVTQVVITYPASFSGDLQFQLRDAAELAGFAPTTTELIQEPVAAAFAFASKGLNVGNTILVYDFGGGTFDLALLTRGTDALFERALPPLGIEQCGGDDLDMALYNYYNQLAQSTLGRSISLATEPDAHFLHLCRQQKEELTLIDHHKFTVFLEPGQVPFSAQIERTTFENLAQPIIQETIQKTLSLINRAATLGHDVETILLVGGSSAVPLVEQMLRTNVVPEVQKWQESKGAVALGAAYYSAPPKPVVVPPPPPLNKQAIDRRRRIIVLVGLIAIVLVLTGLGLLVVVPDVYNSIAQSNINATQTIQANNVNATQTTQANNINATQTIQANNVNATDTAIVVAATVQTANINATTTAIATQPPPPPTCLSVLFIAAVLFIAVIAPRQKN